MYERFPLLLTIKYSYFRKTIACEATKELGWLSISPDCWKSDISNSYLLLYVPSASRHYSAIKMCLIKDISYCQREYIHERVCAGIDTCGLKSASDWYSSFFRTYLRGKKQLNGCQSKDHSIIHCTVCFRILRILTIKKSF